MSRSQTPPRKRARSFLDSSRGPQTGNHGRFPLPVDYPQPNRKVIPYQGPGSAPPTSSLMESLTLGIPFNVHQGSHRTPAVPRRRSQHQSREQPSHPVGPPPGLEDRALVIDAQGQSDSAASVGGDMSASPASWVAYNSPVAGRDTYIAPGICLPRQTCPPVFTLDGGNEAQKDHEASASIESGGGYFGFNQERRQLHKLPHGPIPLQGYAENSRYGRNLLTDGAWYGPTADPGSNTQPRYGTVYPHQINNSSTEPGLRFPGHSPSTIRQTPPHIQPQHPLDNEQHQVKPIYPQDPLHRAGTAGRVESDAEKLRARVSSTSPGHVPPQHHLPAGFQHTLSPGALCAPLPAQLAAFHSEVGPLSQPLSQEEQQLLQLHTQQSAILQRGRDRASSLQRTDLHGWKQQGQHTEHRTAYSYVITPTTPKTYSTASVPQRTAFFNPGSLRQPVANSHPPQSSPVVDPNPSRLLADPGPSEHISPTPSEKDANETARLEAYAKRLELAMAFDLDDDDEFYHRDVQIGPFKHEENDDEARERMRRERHEDRSQSHEAAWKAFLAEEERKVKEQQRKSPPGKDSPLGQEVLNAAGAAEAMQKLMERRVRNGRGETITLRRDPKLKDIEPEGDESRGKDTITS